MICEALVAMSDWPLGQRREVDPTHPKIIGLLRAQFITPMVVPGQRVHVPLAEKPPAPEEPAAASSHASEPVEQAKPATPARAARAPRAASQKRKK